MNREIEICYLCGRKLDNDCDHDHVPPRQFYGKEIRRSNNLNLLTLPVHRSCNKSYQLDEVYFARAIGPIAMKTYSGSALWNDISNSFKHPRSWNLGKMIFDEFDTRPSGLILPNGKIVKRANYNRVRRILWKIVRGLYFNEMGQFLPENKLIGFRVLSPGEKPPSAYDPVLSSPSRGQYPEVFDYKYRDGKTYKNAHIWCWALLLWDYIISFILFHDADCQCKDCENNKA